MLTLLLLALGLALLFTAGTKALESRDAGPSASVWSAAFVLLGVAGAIVFWLLSAS